MSSRAYEASRVASVVAWWRAAGDVLADTYRASRFGRFVARLERVARQSRLVRWVTATPEPDVVVLDLSETLTVGPLIRAVDALAPHLGRQWRGSTLRAVVERGAVVVRAAPVQLASALVLAALVAQIASTWPPTGRVSLAGACFLAGIALVGLRVTWTWAELAESGVGRLAVALLVPPEPPDRETE